MIDGKRSARVAQTSRDYLIFYFTFVLGLYLTIQVGQQGRSIETKNKVLTNEKKLELKSLK